MPFDKGMEAIWNMRWCSNGSFLSSHRPAIGWAVGLHSGSNLGHDMVLKWKLFLFSSTSNEVGHWIALSMHSRLHISAKMLSFSWTTYRSHEVPYTLHGAPIHHALVWTVTIPNKPCLVLSYDSTCSVPIHKTNSTSVPRLQHISLSSS